MRNPYSSLARFAAGMRKPTVEDYVLASLIMLLLMIGFLVVAFMFVSIWIASPLVASIIFVVVAGTFALGYVSWRMDR
jgi:membrane protein YdbS with pleckstrin-like domain